MLAEAGNRDRPGLYDPSTSFGSNHNDSGFVSKSHDGDLKVHFDIKKEDETINDAFARDKLTPGSSLDRISFAIRRALRLGPKQRTTAATRETGRVTDDGKPVCCFVNFYVNMSFFSFLHLPVSPICERSRAMRHLEPSENYNI